MVLSDGRIRYKIQSETMNNVQYCDILKDIVILTLKSVRYNQHLYQQDGDSINWALTVGELLDNELENH